MPTLTVESTTHEVKTAQKTNWVFVLQLINGQIVIGTASNPCRRIAAINSGLNPAVKQSLMVHKIIGIKEVNSERNAVSVYKHFASKVGKSKVLVV